MSWRVVKSLKIFYVIKIIILSLLLIGFTSKPHIMIPNERISISDFPEYKIAVKPFVKAKQLKLKPGTFAWQFRTRYQNAFKQPADFAGKYKVVEWGCGTTCQMVSLINLESGDIIEGFTTSLSSSYALDSKLFITNPFSEDEFKHGRVSTYQSAKLYLFDNEQFTLLKTQSVTL
jgi:hypothetical protein